MAEVGAGSRLVRLHNTVGEKIVKNIMTELAMSLINKYVSAAIYILISPGAPPCCLIALACRACEL